MRKEHENNRDENNSSDSENNQDANNASLNSNENSIENSIEDSNEDQSDITVPPASTIASSDSNDDSNEDQSDITIPPASIIASSSSNENSNDDSNENQSDITVSPASTTVSSYSVIQINVIDTPDPDLCFIMNNVSVKSPSQYATSSQKEITRLLEKEVFEVVNQQDISSNNRIFNSRFVDEVKHSDTNIQDAKLYLRDIAQAYVQFSSELNHFYTRFSEELIKMLDVDHNFFLKHHSLIQYQMQTCN